MRENKNDVNNKSSRSDLGGDGGPSSPHTTGRRDFLAGAAGLAGGAMLVQSGDVFAEADEAENAINQTVSEHARKVTLDPEAFKLPRWMPEKTGGYDLSSVDDNFFAFAKVQANLAGEYSWGGRYGTIMLCPPDRPAFPFLGRLTLTKVFVTSAEEADIPNKGPDDYVLWGTMTTTHVDPRTFEPVSKLRNPYTGKMMEAPTIHYADRLAYRKSQSIIVPGVDPKFYEQPWDKEGGFSQHYIDSGDEISYTLLGAAQKPGPQQPRIDYSFYTVKSDDLMNVSKRSIDTKRDYSALQKASEYSWYGVPRGDEAQLLVHMAGIKTQNIARLPKPIKTGILERHKDRFGV